MNSSTDPAPKFPFFGGHRWVFWIVALLPAVTLLLSFECMKNGNWPAPMLLTVMMMACLWEAHVQTIRTHSQDRRMWLWQFCKRALKTLLRVAFTGLLPFVLLGLLLPSYACYSDRARVTGAMAETSELRHEIERRASTAKTLKDSGLGLEVSKTEGKFRSNGFVLENGSVVLVLEEPPAAVLFTPQLVDANSGAIEWSCRGYPSKSVPARCRYPQ